MTNGSLQSAPDADWYPDPSTAGQLRFWDGAAWTTHIKPTPTLYDMPAPTVAQPLYPQPAPKKLANRAAGIGMVGVLLAAIGVLLAIFAGSTALTVALILGGAIVFTISLLLCIVFTMRRL